MASQQNPIIILGAGISGLALARSPFKRNIPFCIYECDTISFKRAQGYRVRINGVGIAALKACLPMDLYSRLEKCCAIHWGGKGLGPVWQLDAVTAAEHMGTGLEPPPGGKGSGGPPNGQVPGQSLDVELLNADRTVFRIVLMHRVEPHVHFGKEFGSYETTREAVKVRFVDGSEVERCLLVGADGAGSKVKKQPIPEFL